MIRITVVAICSVLASRRSGILILKRKPQSRYYLYLNDKGTEAWGGYLPIALMTVKDGGRIQIPVSLSP